MLTQPNDLENFRKDLYALFPKRRDAIMNLLDAITAEAYHYKSVIQLCEAPCFKRQYASITDAIGDGLSEARWNDIQRLLYHVLAPSKEQPLHCFVVDCTSQPRPYANKLADRTITHSPNPAPGNKPIAVGHQYSLVGLLPNETEVANQHWIAPLDVQRVSSTQKGNELGMQQIIDCIEQYGLQEQLTLSVGDSLYGTETCRATAIKQGNLVHIFRLNSKRNVFFQPTEIEVKPTTRGRKKEYGDVLSLQERNPSTPCDENQTIPWTTRTGKHYQVTIKAWNNMLLRGSRQFKASQHPFNLIQITVTDDQDKPVFKRPMWLAIFGQQRHKISGVDAYHHYTARYDIEHFFRFAKRNLLINMYQTPDVNHEQDWWQLCLIAYVQLFLAKSRVPRLPKPWERYLPEYKLPIQKNQPISPTQTQRGFAQLLNVIGTPAKPCIPRGKPKGRQAGESGLKRPNQSITFKLKKTLSTAHDSIFSRLEGDEQNSNPEKIHQLFHIVVSQLNQCDFSTHQFAQMLLNSS